MASTLLSRQLARAPRLARRQLSTSAVLRAQETATQQRIQRTGTLGGKSAFDTHTTEDLQGIAVQEILSEEGSRRGASMRHFTGACLNLRIICLRANPPGS